MELSVMNVSDAAKELGIQPGTVRDAIARGRLAAIRMGGGEHRAGVLLIERTEIERYKRDHLGKRGVAAASHPLHGVGRRKRDSSPDDGTGRVEAQDVKTGR
jgi:excisionase family DNA binding protein